MNRRKALKILGSFGIATIVGLNNNLHAQDQPSYETTRPSCYKTSEIYGKNIVYTDFSEIDFENLTKEKIPEPYDLKNTLYTPKVEDYYALDDIIVKEYLKTQPQKKLRDLSAKEAINTGIKIVCDILTYLDVDRDKEFLKEYGAYLPVEEYLTIGKGDCDKYTAAFIAILNRIKETNPNLQNIYFSDSSAGGNVIPHEWNSIIFLERNKILTTHIDITVYDNGGKLECLKGYHIPNDPTLFSANFYKNLLDFSQSYELYNEALNNCEEDECKAEIIGELFFSAYMLLDEEKLNEAKKKFFALGPEKYLATRFKDTYSSILYFSYRFEQKKGNTKKAEQYKKTLIKKFPNSAYIESLNMNY
ncbi:MAG: hypothetical protein QXG86_03535 [Candidatus Woesearchaeota archaeon]